MIRIIVVGKFKNDFVNEGFKEYTTRLSRFTKLELVEVKESKVTSDRNRILDSEAESVIKALKDDYTVLLDVKGKEMTSHAFADFIKTRNDMTFVIAGHLGAGVALQERSDAKISLSKMTFPHQLVRLVFIEQLYRAYAINNNIEYHKE